MQHNFDMTAGAKPNRAILLGAASAVATLLCTVVPRIGPLVVASGSLAFAIFGAALDVRETNGRARLLGILRRPEMLFAAWILVACLWAYSPLESLNEALFLAALIFHAVYLLTLPGTLSEPDVRAVSLGILAGFLLGGIFVSYEILAHESIVRYVLTHFPGLERGVEKHAHISDGKIVAVSGNLRTRSSAVFVLFLCPALLVAWRYTRGGLRWLVFVVVAAFCAVMVLSLNTQSQTAQVCALVISVTLPLALVLPRVTFWLIVAGFAVNLFLIVPIALSLYGSDMHKNEKVFPSAQARMIIWNYTAERVLERPVLGVGTNSTRHLDEERVRRGEVVHEKGLAAAPQTRAHPHNIYLQIWYELGIVGVLAFATLGFSLLGRIACLPSSIYPIALAHFAGCMILIMPSYGLWQNWFQAVIVMSTVGLVLIGRAQSGGSPNVTKLRAAP